MARTPRSLEQLHKSSDHLFYEVWMIASLSGGLGSGLLGEGTLANAALESFVIHVRTVLDFLYTEQPRQDDVIAEDFFDSSSNWESVRPPMSVLLSRTKERVGKEIAHLTYARIDITPTEKLWSFLEISAEISKVLNIFVSNVPKERLAPRWQDKFGDDLIGSSGAPTTNP